MFYIFLISFFIFGSIIGSFLNVVAIRINTGKGIGGRSKCMHCGKVLKSYELIPILSFFFLSGKCSKCKSKISIQYPIVEAITGAVSALLVTKIGLINFFTDSISFLYFIFVFSFFCVLICISIYDIKHKIIPPQLSNFATIIALLAVILNLYSVDGFNLLNSLIGALIGFLFFAILFFVSQGRWMGFGDARLALAGGILLGKWGVISALLYSFWLGAFVTILVLIIMHKEIKMKVEIPFGPFISLGIFLSFILSGTSFDLVRVLIFRF